jgi:hypothetical protein
MRLAIIYGFLITLLLPSCSKESFLPNLEGNMVGYAYTFDEFGELLPDHGGITVTTEGDNQYRATTDKTGRFEFSNIPIGTYSLVFEKSGFGTLKYFGVKHLGGTPTIIGRREDGYSIYGFFIYQLPKTKILDLRVENDSLYAKFDLVDKEPYWMLLQIYFSDKPGFRDDEAMQIVNRGLRPGEGCYKCQLVQYKLPDLPSGKLIYYKARIYASTSGIDVGNIDVYGVNNYFDFSLNKTVYPSLGDESSEYSFIMP